MNNMNNAAITLYERKVRKGELEVRTDTRLLLAEWGFHIFSSSLAFLMMGATFLLAVCICTDLALGSMLSLQIIQAVFDNPIAFAVVWVIVYLAILACTAIKTVEDQKVNYRVYSESARHSQRKRLYN